MQKRMDTAHGPVQTNKVRCHVPAPCCWACRRAVASCEKRVVRRHWHLRSRAGTILLLQLVGCPPGPRCLWLLALCGPGGTRGPVRAPPSAHFRNREGSCRNPWVLGRRKVRPGDPCQHLRRRAVRPPPGTLLLFSAPGTWRMYRRPPYVPPYQTTILPSF